MEGWQQIQLSPSKLPIYEEGEIETVVQKAVALYEGDKVSKYERCVCYLTSHRLILQDQDNKLTPIGFLHANLAAVDTESGGITGSPKIKFFLVGRNSVSYKLSFRSGNRDEFLAKWKQVVQSKAWVQKSNEEAKKKEAFSTTKAGITGIMRTTEQKAKDTDKTLQEAFSDISALMEKAREMVGLAEKFTSSLTKENKGTEQDNELRSMLISMGIASPVTKESAGSLYHTQLSRQLADWLHKPLEKSGGMLALPDLYSLFNRARGTSLVSPDDLYRACVLFEELGLPVRLKRFESGVLVVQSVNYNDDAIGKQIADLIRLDGPQTPFEVARTKNISIALATEELLTAERLGLVCRDETLEGVTFYLNFFNDKNLVKLYLKS